MCNDNTIVYSMKIENQTKSSSNPVSLKDLHHRLISNEKFNLEFDRWFNEYIKDNKHTEE